MKKKEKERKKQNKSIEMYKENQQKNDYIYSFPYI